MEEFSAFGEEYYFYYSLGEKKYRFWNSTGILTADCADGAILPIEELNVDYS